MQKRDTKSNGSGARLSREETHLNRATTDDSGTGQLQCYPGVGKSRLKQMHELLIHDYIQLRITYNGQELRTIQTAIHITHIWL